MFMKNKVYENLDMEYIFNKLNVHTPYGEDEKKQMAPFFEKEKLLREYDLIDEIIKLISKNRYSFVDIRNHFKHIKDLRGSFKRVEEKMVLSEVELYEIKSFIFLLKDISLILKKIKWNMPEELIITSMPKMEKLLDPQGSGVSAFYIYDSYSKALSKIRAEIKALESEVYTETKKIKEEVESSLHIKIRPNGEVSINKMDEDLLEKANECLNLEYSHENYMNITYKLKIYSDENHITNKLNDLKILEEEEEFQVRKNLTLEIKKTLDKFYKNIQAISKVDLLISKAYLAIGTKSVRPKISIERKLYIKDGVYIKLDETLKKQGKDITPISVNLKNGVTCITGANMGGKTISLKTMGLLCAMAQYALFVPAKEMIYSLNDYIFFSVGDLQCVDKGLSTFGAEILELKDIINKTKETGLILIDELGRGTNPQEGFALSKALINYMKKKENITIITSHYDGLTKDKEIKHLQVRGLSCVDMNSLKNKINKSKSSGIEKIHEYMDYTLIEIDNEDKVPRDAINIARLMGLSEEIIKEAEKYIS